MRRKSGVAESPSKIGRLLQAYEPACITFYVVLCFIPFLSGWTSDFLENNGASILYDSARELSYRFVLLGSFSACVPCLLDLFLDYVSITIDRCGNLSRFKIVFAILATDLFIFAYVIPSDAIYLLPSIYRAREIIIVIIVMSYLCKLQSGLINYISTIAIIISFSIPNLMKLYIIYLNIASEIKYILETFFFIIQIVSTIYTFLLFLYALWSIRLKSISSELSNHEKSSIVYLLSTLFYIMGLSILYPTVGNTSWQNTKLSWLLSYSLLTLSFAIIVTLLNGRLDRLESAKTKVRSLLLLLLFLF